MPPEELSHRKPRSYRDLLKGVLSDEELGLLPRAFDIIGDIVIIELTPELRPKAGLIGQAIMRFHRNVRSVFMKASPVKGEYRLRDLVHIAGEPRSITIHTEYGLRFMVDVRRTYFSPRLSWEHRRVALQVKDGEIVVDMFSGVGPFAIHIASLREAIVYAIDINPYAYDCILENIRLNRKKLKGLIVPVNADAISVSKIMPRIADRIIMNLPERSLEFIPSACNLLRTSGGVIHYYTFENEPNEIEKAICKLRNALLEQGYRITRILQVRRIREVAPRRWNIVIDIQVTKS